MAAKRKDIVFSVEEVDKAPYYMLYFITYNMALCIGLCEQHPIC